jgi:hypothetical protein
MIGTKGILMEKKIDVLYSILFFLLSIPYNLNFLFKFYCIFCIVVDMDSIRDFVWMYFLTYVVG